MDTNKIEIENLKETILVTNNKLNTLESTLGAIKTNLNTHIDEISKMNLIKNDNVEFKTMKYDIETLKKFSISTVEINELKTSIQTLESKMDEINKKLDNVTEKQKLLTSNMDSHIAKCEPAITNCKENIEHIIPKLSNGGKGDSEKETICKLDKIIAIMGKQLEINARDIVELNDKIVNNKKIEALEKEIGSLSMEILNTKMCNKSTSNVATDLQSIISALNARISGLEKANSPQLHLSRQSVTNNLQYSNNRNCLRK